MLPRWELSFYLLASVGFHVYSFYEVYRVSREHEEELDREFDLETSTLFGGLKKVQSGSMIKPFQFSNLISIFCITFVFGVGPGVVLSSDWKLNTFVVEKAVSTPHGVRAFRTLCLYIVSWSPPKILDMWIITSAVCANFPFVKIGKFLPDLATQYVPCM